MFSPYLLNSAKLDNFYFYNFCLVLFCVFFGLFFYVLFCLVLLLLCGFFCNLYGIMTSYYIVTTGSLNQVIVSRGNGKVRFQNEVQLFATFASSVFTKQLLFKQIMFRSENSMLQLES